MQKCEAVGEQNTCLKWLEDSATLKNIIFLNYFMHILPNKCEKAASNISNWLITILIKFLWWSFFWVFFSTFICNYPALFVCITKDVWGCKKVECDGWLHTWQVAEFVTLTVSRNRGTCCDVQPEHRWGKPYQHSFTFSWMRMKESVKSEEVT